MAFTDVMDDINYGTINFNINEAESRHPLWMTESHFVYHLIRDGNGRLNSHTDHKGEPICSPRQLSCLCINQLVCDPDRMHRVGDNEIPADLYPSLLTEAIFQRELSTIEYLVSTWPRSVLDLQSIIPKEDLVEPNLLTMPVNEQGDMSILDYIMSGLLGQRPQSKLQTANFSGFKQDRKLCRELTRLPILWMKEENKSVEKLYEILSRNMDISKEKVSKYLNRIKCLYGSLDSHAKCESNRDPITIIIDCKVTLDDVPIGLCLQEETPYRFACQRLWMEPIAEMSLPLNRINRVLEPRDLTHLQAEDANLCSNPEQFDVLMDGILTLPNLKALSLPNTIHTDIYPESAPKLNQTLKQMKNLKKLNFSSSNLKDNLSVLLNGLPNIQYLSLRDCRLTQTDLQFLLHWDSSQGLVEINLSRNNLKTLASLCAQLIETMTKLVCFSASYCSFTLHDLQSIVAKCCESCTCLKLLGLQTYTPLPVEDIKSILQEASNIDTLQRCLLLPEHYAFPGNNELSRYENKENLVETCEEFLASIGRSDIEIDCY